MKIKLLIILMMLGCGLAIAGTTQISPVSNSNQTVVMNDNFDSLQNGVNSLANLYNNFIGYFTNGILGIANGGTGKTTTQDVMNELLPPQAGHAGQFLTTDGSIYSWETAGIKYTSGTTYPIYNTSKTTPDLGGSYAKYWEIVVPYSGTISTTFGISNTYGGAQQGYGRIYVNGIAVGTERRGPSYNGTLIYTEDITVVAGDKVQLYGKNDGHSAENLSNFYLYTDTPYTIFVNIQPT